MRFWAGPARQEAGKAHAFVDAYTTGIAPLQTTAPQLRRSLTSALLATSGKALGIMYLAGALVGFVALGVPHGSHFNSLADIAISTTALFLGAWAWWRCTLGPLATSLLLVIGTLAVSAGVYSGRGDYVSVSAAVTYIWLAVFASLFLSPVRTWIHLGVIATAYAVVLALDGNSGAPAEWLFIVMTATVAALVTFAIRTELLSISERDPLTGLANRAGLTRALEREFAKARRSQAPLSVAVIDLDGFKTLNDDHGHLAGDQALIAATRSWQAVLRRSDMIARFGGDEFVVLLPDSRVLQAGQTIRRMHNADGTCRFSAGLASWDGLESPTELIARADKALYQAKSRRRVGAVVVAPQVARSPLPDLTSKGESGQAAGVD
jgi:diguanylate cyclase (GGDEF)-like protein